jgi:TusA-related sulfurtransferase
MKLKVVTRNTFEANAKLTPHLDGKSGFSKAAVEMMKIDENSFIKIAVNEDPKDDNLYAFVSSESSPESLKVNKAGRYYYLNTRMLFNDLRINYSQKKFTYDIVEDEYQGEKMFKLIRRELSNTKRSKK